MKKLVILLFFLTGCMTTQFEEHELKIEYVDLVSQEVYCYDYQLKENVVIEYSDCIFNETLAKLYYSVGSIISLGYEDEKYCSL
jgi:hypothetical protein